MFLVKFLTEVFSVWSVGMSNCTVTSASIF